MDTVIQAIQELVREKNQAISHLWEFQTLNVNSQSTSRQLPPNNAILDKLIRFSDVKYEDRYVYFRVADYEVEKSPKLILYCLNYNLAILEIVGCLDYQTGQIGWLNN